MYNGFLDKRIKTKNYSEFHNRERLKLLIQKKELLRIRSIFRTNQWINQVDKKIADILRRGSTILVNDVNHHFRPDSQTIGIYVKRYQ